MSGNAVGGKVSYGLDTRAALWTNATAESFVDLTPPGESFGEVRGVHGNTQVGYTARGAGLWRGSAESWISLQPSVATGSQANAVFNDYQVGLWANINVDFITRAAFWNGSAGTFENLGAVINAQLTPPPGFTWGRSEATGVWADATTIYVSGFVWDRNAIGQDINIYSLLWSRPIPSPATLAPLAAAALLASRRRRD